MIGNGYIQAKFNILKFIPGTFLGAAALFSSNGEWLSAFVGLFIGAIFGFLMSYSGDVLHKLNTERIVNKNMDNQIKKEGIN